MNHQQIIRFFCAFIVMTILSGNLYANRPTLHPPERRFAATDRTYEPGTFEDQLGCDTPSAQPRYIGIGTVNATNVNGGLEPVADAEGYLVVVSTGTQLGFTPAKGTSYTVGSQVGNCKVVKAGAGYNFTAEGLSANTNYYVYAFSMKTGCAGGPVYRSWNPTVVMVHTAAAGSNP